MESVNMKAGVVFNMKEDQNIPFKKKKKKDGVTGCWSNVWGAITSV